MFCCCSSDLAVVPDDGVIGGGDIAECPLGPLQRGLLLDSDPVKCLVIELKLTTAHNILWLTDSAVELGKGCERNLLDDSPLGTNVNRAAVLSLQNICILMSPSLLLASMWMLNSAGRGIHTLC